MNHTQSLKETQGRPSVQLSTGQHVCVSDRHEHDYCHYNSGQVIRLDPHQLCLARQPRSCAKYLVLPDSPLAG